MGLKIQIILLLLGGFIFLIKGADLLVEGSSSLAKRFNVSELAIGLTVVAFGTSTPELFVNIFASLNGNSAIAVGNILGSNIFNILFILGISSMIVPLTVTHGTVWKEIPLSLLAAIVLGIIINDALIDKSILSTLSRGDGLILLSFFIIFIYYTMGMSPDMEEVEEIEGCAPHKKHSLPYSLMNITLGLAGLVIGGKLVVDAAVKLALTFGISQSLIGLTIVAAGTSLPELATSAVAAYKKKPDIAIGNVVGSNIFNIFFILGISAVINPIQFDPLMNRDVAMTIAASLILFIAMFTGKKHILERWEGALLMLTYLAYLVFIIIQK